VLGNIAGGSPIAAEWLLSMNLVTSLMAVLLRNIDLDINLQIIRVFNNILTVDGSQLKSADLLIELKIMTIVPNLLSIPNPVTILQLVYNLLKNSRNALILVRESNTLSLIERLQFHTGDVATLVGKVMQIIDSPLLL